MSLSLQPSNEDYFISNNGYNPPKPSIFNLKKKPPKVPKVTHTVYDIKDIKDDKLGPEGILIGKKPCLRKIGPVHIFKYRLFQGFFCISF